MEIIFPQGYVGNNVNIIKKIKDDFANEREFHYLFFGINGAGKTFLARIMLEAFNKNKISDREKMKEFEARNLYPLYLQKLYSNYSDKAEALMKLQHMMRREAVLLDDIGDEKNYTSENKASLFIENLLEDRCNWIDKGRGKYTIITTNATGSELQEKYGDRVLDRLYQHFTMMYFKDISFREKKITKIYG